MGALSDRIGRRPLLIGCTAATILTAYPVMLWLAGSPSFGRLLAGFRESEFRMRAVLRGMVAANLVIGAAVGGAQVDVLELASL